MIEPASEIAALPRDPPELPVPGAARLFSRIAAVLAPVVALLFNRW
jgi:hypothetical protein